MTFQGQTLTQIIFLFFFSPTRFIGPEVLDQVLLFLEIISNKGPSYQTLIFLSIIISIAV